MIYIAHRINTIEELEKIPSHYGVEVDLRDSGNRLILQHDPFSDGEDFEAYLAHYHHALIILNIKSERIEFRILELMHRHTIKDFFFLDSSIPMMYLLSTQGETQQAVRFSEFESLETVLAMKHRAQWVWVDCFTKLPITQENYCVLKDAGYKLCLVSPELQGRDGDIERYRDYCAQHKIIFDAVCSKAYNVDRWGLTL